MSYPQIFLTSPVAPWPPRPRRVTSHDEVRPDSGFNLIELKDWNCCGSSSAGTLCKDLALAMAARNLSLAPPDRPLVAMWGAWPALPPERPNLPGK